MIKHPPMRGIFKRGLVAGLAVVAFSAGTAFAATPPVVSITSGPEDQERVSIGSVEFNFASDQAGSTFQCGFAGPAYGPFTGWSACSGPQTLESASVGFSTFAVRALNNGETSEPILRHIYFTTLKHSERAFISTSGLKLANRGVPIQARCNLDCRMSVKLVFSPAAAEKANVVSPVAVKRYRLDGGTPTRVRVRIDPNPAAILAAADEPVRGLRAVIRFVPISG